MFQQLLGERIIFNNIIGVMDEMEIIYLGFLSSLLAVLAAGFGALPIVLGRQFSDDTMDIMLGFAAGVMLAAAAFSLLVPSINLGGPLSAVLGLMVGAITIHFIDLIIPHFHPVAGPAGYPSTPPRPERKRGV